MRKNLQGDWRKVLHGGLPYPCAPTSIINLHRADMMMGIRAISRGHATCNKQSSCEAAIKGAAIVNGAIRSASTFARKRYIASRRSAAPIIAAISQIRRTIPRLKKKTRLRFSFPPSRPGGMIYERIIYPTLYRRSRIRGAMKLRAR